MAHDPCPRCQLAGPHADAAECVGALLVVLRMREQELVWLRHMVKNLQRRGVQP